MANKQLKLENQICFPLYAASRLVIQEYKPYLVKLGITYPQYLVLLVLWEADSISVSEITQRLILNTNTVTPILKRMEAQGIITRQRSENDERKVIVSLTTRGQALQIEAASIPEKLLEGLTSRKMKVEDLTTLKSLLYGIIDHLSPRPE